MIDDDLAIDFKILGPIAVTLIKLLCRNARKTEQNQQETRKR
jgi:hypothetical protein